MDNKDDVERQKEAIERFTKLFLNYVYSDINDKIEKQRFDEMTRILDECGGSLDGFWLRRLLHELEDKVIKEYINPLCLLAQSVDVDDFGQYGFPELLIGKVKDSLNHKAKMSATKAGKGNKKTEAFDAMTAQYEKWSADPSLYGNQERYIEDMEGKLGISFSTVRRNLKKIKEDK